MTAPRSTPHPGRAVRLIREGFHRHDRAADPPLEPLAEPRPGLQIKLQLNLYQPLACASYPDEVQDWLAMSGVVSRVLGPGRVEVGGLVASTDRAPLDFDGEWTAELVRERDATFPWSLARLHPASGPVAVGSGLLADDGPLFRVACSGEAAAVPGFLHALAIRFNDEPLDDALLVQLPVGNQSARFILGGVPEELAGWESRHELLLAGADAVLFVDPDEALRAAVSRRLQLLGQAPGQLVEAQHTGGENPLEALKLLARALLGRLTA